MRSPPPTRLAEPLRNGTLGDADLEAVQRRRTFPMRVIQAMQVTVQQRVIDRVLGSDQPVKAPWFVKLFNYLPFLSRMPARLIGMGVRPEHIRTPEAPRARS